MSIGILWEPVQPPSGTRVATNTPSHFLKCMERAFGGIPSFLGLEDLAVLRGMDATGLDGVSDLIQAIESYSVIRIWTEA